MEPAIVCQMYTFLMFDRNAFCIRKRKKQITMKHHPFKPHHTKLLSFQHLFPSYLKHLSNFYHLFSKLFLLDISL